MSHLNLTSTLWKELRESGQLPSGHRGDWFYVWVSNMSFWHLSQTPWLPCDCCHRPYRGSCDGGVKSRGAAFAESQLSSSLVRRCQWLTVSFPMLSGWVAGPGRTMGHILPQGSSACEKWLPRIQSQLVSSNATRIRGAVWLALPTNHIISSHVQPCWDPGVPNSGGHASSAPGAGHFGGCAGRAHGTTPRLQHPA